MGDPTDPTNPHRPDAHEDDGRFPGTTLQSGAPGTAFGQVIDPDAVEAQARDRSPLEVVVADLQNSSTNVHALLDELTERLRPVLREPIEEGSSVGAIRERREPSPLVVDLEHEVHRGLSAQYRMRDLLDRLEV